MAAPDNAPYLPPEVSVMELAYAISAPNIGTRELNRWAAASLDRVSHRWTHRQQLPWRTSMRRQNTPDAGR